MMRYLFQLPFIPVFLLTYAGVSEAGFFGTFNPVPEPPMFALMGIGAGSMLLLRYVQRKNGKK